MSGYLQANCICPILPTTGCVVQPRWKVSLAVPTPHVLWVVLSTAWTVAASVAFAEADAAPLAAASTPSAASPAATDDPAAVEALFAQLAADQAAAQPPAVVAAPAQTISQGFSNPAMSLIFDGAVAAYSEPKSLSTGGHDPKRNGFNLQQLEMHLSSSVDPYLHFEANIVYGQFGVEVEEAYAETLSLPAGLQLKAGQFLTAFGRANPTHPHSWHFTDQVLMVGKFFGSEGNRGLGVQLGWLTPLPWFTELKLSATDASGACCARSWLGAQDLPVRQPGDVLYTLTAKSFVPLDDDWSVTLGLSGQSGPHATGNANRAEVAAADLYVRYRPAGDPQRRSLSLQVEHAIRGRQVPGRSLVDQAGYAQLVAALALRWEAGLRTEWTTGLQDDPLDPLWVAARQRHTAQLTFYPSHFSRLRLQASMDRPAWLDRPIYGVVLALETLIGEHGAHNF